MVSNILKGIRKHKRYFFHIFYRKTVFGAGEGPEAVWESGLSQWKQLCEDGPGVLTSPNSMQESNPLLQSKSREFLWPSTEIYLSKTLGSICFGNVTASDCWKTPVLHPKWGRGLQFRKTQLAFGGNPPWACQPSVYLFSETTTTFFVVFNSPINTNAVSYSWLTLN